jgi:hypothetical protein
LSPHSSLYECYQLKYRTRLPKSQVYPAWNSSSVGNLTCGPLAALSLIVAMLSSLLEDWSMSSASSLFMPCTCEICSLRGRLCHAPAPVLLALDVDASA